MTINMRGNDIKPYRLNNERLEHWLAEVSNRLAQSLTDHNLPVSPGRWIDFLRLALDPQADLAHALQTLALPAPVLASLFEITITYLPPTDNDLLMAFLRLQNSLLAQLEQGQHHNLSVRPEKILEATTQLTQKLLLNPDPNDLMTKAVSTIAETFGFPSINLFLLKGPEKAMILQAALWQNESPAAAEIDLFTQEVKRTSNAVGQVIDTGQAAMTTAVPYTAPAWMANLASEMAVPLIMDDQIIGVLHIFSHSDPLPTLGNLAILQSIGQQLVLAIENLQLHIANRRRVQEQRILLQNSAALGSSLDRDRILELMAQKMTEALDVGSCTICRWREEDRSLIAIAEHIRLHQDNPKTTWRSDNQPLPLRDDPIGRQALRTKRPVVISAVQANSRAANSPKWSAPGWQTMLAIPLQAHGQPLGLVELYDRNPYRVFSPEAIQLGKALASQAAIAIERVDLFYEIRNRLAEVSTFYTLSQQLISTLDLDDLLDNLVRTLRQAVGCRACTIFLLDKSNRHLEIRAAAGLSNHWKKETRFAIGQGAAGQAIVQRRAVYIPDTQKDPDFPYFEPQIRSLIVVPMIYRDRVIGAINLDDTEPHAFGKTQERLLTVAAAQAAVAIENATLFQQILSEEERTRIIIQHMADGLLMLGPTGKIERVNSTLALMLDMHPGQIIGQSVETPYFDRHLAAICAPITTEQQPGVFSAEVTLPGTQPRILRIFATPVSDETGQPLGEVRVVHDITKERELDKMKSDLISTVSHELRTPLFSIRGFARLLLAGNVSPETQQDFLSIIERQASQLSDLVTNLLDSDKLSAGILSINKKPVQMIDLIHQTVLKLQGFAYQEEVTLQSQLPAMLPETMGDAQRLEQVLTNLIGNAIKFTPAGGTVTVTASLANASLLIKVIDTGVGIPATDLERIFTKYYQVQEDHPTSKPGSGLGLHISRQLIEGHSGKIWAESKLNQGSTFFIQLPCSQSEQP